ncbi:DUF4258 domain-containing protein [Thalassolituus oleivorans]|uniref:DUF4258 domain-containing protein n=1 Tax=Thalassolituus oleivorans TaxID=187493 RepID=UPI001CE26A49|nr:DUF4258 domain-containing protein [Thalassolituus oleivorans]MCA6128480.1 hypothetical protein [Thalassolituus oleivorans 4BN06-13]
MAIELPKFKAHEVRAEIKRIADSSTHFVEFLDHALDRMEQRGVTTRQALRVLRNGDQEGNAEWCTDKERGWRCRLSRITAGEKITVIAKLVERKNSTCLVVTTWEG